MTHKGIHPLFGFFSFLYMAGLYWLSDQPGGNTPPPFPGADKVVHFVLYAGLGGLLRLTINPVLWVIALGSFYGVLDEFHQSFVPGRTADPFDVLADILGTVFGCFVINWLRRP